MLTRNISCIPVLDGSQRIVDLLFWESVFHEGRESQRPQAIDVPVVIMAGGRGTRLDPFTRVLPKPLIPVGEKTVIEVIIDTFLQHSVNCFFISVNNKARIIKSYFEELSPPYRVEYVEETEPLGTAGALAALRGQITGPFMVTNCDVIVRADYAQLLAQHRQDGNAITLVTSMKSFNIPYGVCELSDTGSLARIAEKPKFDFLVSTGLYVLEGSTLDLIPLGRTYHITQLIDEVRSRGGRIGIYPVGEDSWLDTGEWQEYRRTLQTFNQ
jgi:NDP-sugar pyrophosphorylase family protein